MTIAKILVSIAVVGFAVVPALADLNRTHATNPTWVGHARFHVVWQVLSYLALGTLAIGLLWAPGPLGERATVYLVSAIAVCVYSGFFGAVLTMGIYGGRTHDENGYQPLRACSERALDLNVLVFTATTTTLVAGVALAATH